MKKNQFKKLLAGCFLALWVSCVFIACKKTIVNPVPQSNVIVTTLAGGGVGNPATVKDPLYGNIGSADGLGTAASFNAPAGIATDASGNIYVGEAGNHDIRKITPAGVVTTFAGNIAGGSANGIGTAASFSTLAGIVTDADGNVYVADAGNQLIRKITPAGVVTTLAGNGVAGADNGPAASASFHSPLGVAVDATGNVYVADSYNNMIRKITPNGIVSTFAGSGARGYDNGPGATATFTSIRRVAVDGSGNVYVADFTTLRKITPDGVVSTLAGRSTPEIGANDTIIDGKGSAASFAVTDGISVDAAGNIYVGDLGAIRKVTPDGTVTTLAGGPGTATFGILRGVVVNKAGNLIYVSDLSKSLISKVEIK